MDLQRLLEQRLGRHVFTLTTEVSRQVAVARRRVGVLVGEELTTDLRDSLRSNSGWAAANLS